MSARAFWGRIVAVTAVAAMFALVLSPPRPQARFGVVPAIAGGAACGFALFVLAVGRRPRLPRRGRAAITFAKHCILGVCAANEEVVWRRVLLGELLPAGSVVAVAASSAAFALAHPRSRRLHLATGTAFGGIYLVSGALAAAVAAHWLYNVLVAAHVERGPP